MRAIHRLFLLVVVSVGIQAAAVGNVQAQCTNWNFSNLTNCVVDILICNNCVTPPLCLSGATIDPGSRFSLCVGACTGLTFTVDGASFVFGYEGPIGATGKCVCVDDVTNEMYIYDGPCLTCP